ncbi:hypothetical protein AVDCRST_MAG82-3079, partial [uncultured Rubrobacteraceae bacterium]
CWGRFVGTGRSPALWPRGRGAFPIAASALTGRRRPRS